MKLVIVFAALVAIATVVDGLYNGEKPEDWPTQDPKQTCNGWRDCQHHVGSYCVPDSCQKNADCPDVGHIDHGLITSKGCNSGTCVYQEAIIIAK